MKTATDTLSLLPPIFRKCVAPDDTRYVISFPFRIGDKVYATDGRICVRCPWREEFGEMQNDGKVPPADELGWGEEFHEEPLGVGEFPKPFNPHQCNNCSGSGLCICADCETEHDCGTCDGSGEVSAEQWVFVWGEHAFRERYIHTLDAAGALLFPRVKGRFAARFTITPDIEGLLSPMSMPAAAEENPAWDMIAGKKWEPPTP